MFVLPRIECHATIPVVLARAYCTVPVMFWILQFSQPTVLGFVFEDHPESSPSTLNQCWDVGCGLKLHLELGLIHLIGSCRNTDAYQQLKQLLAETRGGSIVN